MLLNLYYRRTEFDEILICGDFNYNYLDYDEKLITDNIFLIHGLKQNVKFPTRVTATSSTLIDLVYTDNSSLIKSINRVEKFSNSCDHETISITLNAHQNYNKKKLITVVKQDLKDVECFSENHWIKILENLSSEQMYSEFDKYIKTQYEKLTHQKPLLRKDRELSRLINL